MSDPQVLIRLRDRIRSLEDENARLRSEISTAEARIQTELEPRLASERRAYDRHVREPQPGDGPDYHAEHAFWRARREETGSAD